MQSLGHGWREQFVVMDLKQIVHDEPDGFFRGHPLLAIETGKVYRTRKSAQGPLAAQVEVEIEIAHGQFAQRAVHRLAVAAAGVVRFGDLSPIAVPPGDRLYM